VTYYMAGDPDLEMSFRVLDAMARGGADVLEIGAPFTDPMADGPSIQRAALRALAAQTRLTDVLAVAARLRAAHPGLPLVVMGYANPVHAMGFDAFAEAAAAAGVDGVITVDLPPEEDAPLRLALAAQGIAVIRLATPTTHAARMAVIADGASGFVYYVSVAGVTGTGQATPDAVAAGVAQARALSGLPVVVGFGVRTPEQAAGFARIGDGVVVGSALVDAAAEAVATGADPAEAVGSLTKALASALKSA
jgi:tryptophan synthase alpha chain